MSAHPEYRNQPETRRPSPPNKANETAFEAYIRILHENNVRAANEPEPVRGRDPWLGLAL